MSERYFLVNVDSWGHTPGLPRGTTVKLNDTNKAAFPGDIDWAIENGVVIETDAYGRVLEKPGGPVVRMADDGTSLANPLSPWIHGGAVAEEPDSDLIPLAEDTGPPDASEETLTPAQKAARTRAANAAAAAPSA